MYADEKKGEKSMAITTHLETRHGLPAADAEALEKIAKLARQGKSPEEIASIIQAHHPDVAEETLAAYHALREENAVAKAKKFIG